MNWSCLQAELRMKKSRLVQQRLPESYIRQIGSRDAALWIGEGFDDPTEIDAIIDLIQLPWRMVLCESPESRFVQRVESVVQRSDSQFTRARGFLHIVARNPEGLTLPPRALPVYLLNGRNDATDP